MTHNLKIECYALRSRVFGVNVFRGFARLCDLADISKPDIYDAKNNPRGIQRDLSPAHARQAYEYAKTKSIGFWPEIFLSVRKKDIVTFSPLSPELPDVGVLSLDLTFYRKRNDICVARVDGNHRLHYADGAEKGFTRIEKQVSFCLATGLTRTDEIEIFKDINNNQKAMNTSHLDGIEARLTEEEQLKRRYPELYITKRLNEDSDSPLFGRIWSGGKKPVGVDIPMRGLKTGIEYMLTRSTQLPRLDNADAQYKLIRNYFQAVKHWQPTAWKTPKEYTILRGSGLWAICFLGAQVIDRSILMNKFDASTMQKILESGKTWDWSNKGDFKGLGGRAGAIEISNRIARRLTSDGQMSTNDLFEEIMAST